jgi:hypothetical protein
MRVLTPSLLDSLGSRLIEREEGDVVLQAVNVTTHHQEEL